MSPLKVEGKILETVDSNPADEHAVATRLVSCPDRGRLQLPFSSQFRHQDNLTTKDLIIHLTRAQKRRQHAERLSCLLSFSTSILTAIDGRLLLERAQQEFYQRNLHQPLDPSELTDAEIGCFPSHREVRQVTVDMNIDIAFENSSYLSLSLPSNTTAR
ncbi:glycosyltransferase family 25 protein [Rhizobium sp. BR 314]|uniref:glycosyltransferase family 25 protein n=1 Tax=Rhizobium sp. BR 314 TaxID=3040013 RepID=UPI0039BEF157